MRIEECPKRLSNCHQECPLFPCWAYDKCIDKKERKVNDGWE